jgi:hypothetical protein
MLSDNYVAINKLINLRWMKAQLNFFWRTSLKKHSTKRFCHFDDSIICKYGIWIKIHFAKILEQCNKWSTLQLTIKKDVECIGKM